MSQVKGVIHVGAHEAEELDEYLCAGVDRVFWVEANPEKRQVLEKKTAGFERMLLGAFAAGSRECKMTLNLASNGQSSSLLDFGTHSVEHPQIRMTGAVEVDVRPIDVVLDECELNRSEFNLLNLDVQGYELEALRGAEKQLAYVDYVYAEVNARELYLGCPLVEDIDAFLAGFGFCRVRTVMTRHGWGDALYSKC